MPFHNFLPYKDKISFFDYNFPILYVKACKSDHPTGKYPIRNNIVYKSLHFVQKRFKKL